MKATIYNALRTTSLALVLASGSCTGLHAAKPGISPALAGVLDLTGNAGPRRIDVEAEDVDSPELVALISRYRQNADRYIFLSGGASKMSEEKRLKLIGLFRAFETLAASGMRFAVGDGGTKAGIMEAAGMARLAAGLRFDVLGVSPAPEIAPGKTAVDPNHSDVIGVTSQTWVEEQTRRGWEPSNGYWGSETHSMYDIFGRISAERPSVTLVANGGGITLDEIAENVKQGRSMIVVQGSGRVADAIVEVLFGVEADPIADEKIQAEYDALKVKVQRANLPRGLFTPFPLESGSDALAALLTTVLSDTAPARELTRELREEVRAVAFEHLRRYQEGYEGYSGSGMTFQIGDIRPRPSGEAATVDIVLHRDHSGRGYHGQLIVDLPSLRVVHGWNR